MTLALIALACPAPAAATWTIVAVDAATGEVGSAGASCTPFVAGVAKLVPGRGAVVAQAASNMVAKAEAAKLIAGGADAAAIIAKVTDPAFDPAFVDQQYGVALLGRDGRAQSAAFTGAATAEARGQRLGRGYAAQGNILASAAVLDATAAAFETARGRPLAERLMAALEAGSSAGGDRRCPGANRAIRLSGRGAAERPCGDAVAADRGRVRRRGSAQSGRRSPPPLGPRGPRDALINPFAAPATFFCSCTETLG